MLDPYFKHRYPAKHLKKWLVWPWSEYRVLRDAEAVLFTSETERQRARESFWLYRARERAVGYGISPPNLHPGQIEAFREAFSDLRGKRFLLFLGRIHPKKGCDLLIEGFARTTRCDLALDGAVHVRTPVPRRACARLLRAAIHGRRGSGTPSRAARRFPPGRRAMIVPSLTPGFIMSRQTSYA